MFLHDKLCLNVSGIDVVKKVSDEENIPKLPPRRDAELPEFTPAPEEDPDKKDHPYHIVKEEEPATPGTPGDDPSEYLTAGSLGDKPKDLIVGMGKFWGSCNLQTRYQSICSMYCYGQIYSSHITAEYI